jgi:hypothetical protein
MSTTLGSLSAAYTGVSAPENVAPATSSDKLQEKNLFIVFMFKSSP